MVASKPRKTLRPQLRVVFDTNALYTDSESYLVRTEVASLIRASTYADLEIQWYLPEVVCHERQYQMRKKALELLPSIERLNRLLGHNLAITRETLIDNVQKVVSRRSEELGFLTLSLNYAEVNWSNVILDSAYRQAPFKDGETEKGFRDRILVESFLQLLDDSPKTPAVCRVVLVSGDILVGKAVASRIGDAKNATVVPDLEELKGLINTLVSQVDEGFLAVLKPKAQKLFFVWKETSSLFYKENIRSKLTEKFADRLKMPPYPSATRTNGVWKVSPPNFVQKSGHRVRWASRINIEADASKKIEVVSPTMNYLTTVQPDATIAEGNSVSATLAAYSRQVAEWGQNSKLVDLGLLDWNSAQQAMDVPPATTLVTTHKGIDTYEVLWSADVSTKRELRRPSIDDIRSVETIWEQVT
jgi:hypothetical protein